MQFDNSILKVCNNKEENGQSRTKHRINFERVLIKYYLYWVLYNYYSLMCNQQSDRFSHILSTFDFILNEPLLNPIQQKAQEKLLNLSKRQGQLAYLLELIQRALRNYSQVILRLKLLCLLQQLLFRQTLEENIEIISSIISQHERRVKGKHSDNMDLTDMNTYLHINVQLPYLNFLRKMISWQQMDIITDSTNQINIGFSLINKLKDLIMLKRIFHHYGCYYPTHRYAISLYRACLSNIKKIWCQICYLVKDITVEAFQTNSVLAEEYLFICAAEQAQDLLMEFVYSGYFSKKINKQQKIKYMVLLKPQISALEQERKRKSCEQQAMKCLLEKRESRRSLDKETEKRTGYSDNLDQKLNTEMQIQILDSILRLESLLSIDSQ